MAGRENGYQKSIRKPWFLHDFMPPLITPVREPLSRKFAERRCHSDHDKALVYGNFQPLTHEVASPQIAGNKLENISAFGSGKFGDLNALIVERHHPNANREFFRGSLTVQGSPRIAGYPIWTGPPIARRATNRHTRI